MTAGEMAEKAAKKAAGKVPSWIELLLVPSLNEIRGELRAINTRLDFLENGEKACCGITCENSGC